MKIKDIIFLIEDISFKEALEYIVEKSQKRDSKTFVVTINPEIIMLAKSNSEYEHVLKSANLALADGVGILWAGKTLGKSFKGRSHGVDLVNGLAKEVAKKPITVGFLGGAENVAQSTADCLKKIYPDLKVAFALQEWPVDANSLSCDILFVAFGSPKQEKWIFNHMEEIDSKVFIGVGGAFDFISGKVMRAPVFVRQLGLEWLFRLIVQPWRIKRQFALVKFVGEVLREKLK